jgi:hypothetical protein
MIKQAKPSKIKKVSILFNGKTRYVDIYFLNAFAITQFGELYESKGVKKEVNRLLRDLMKDEVDPHPQILYRKILFTTLPINTQKQLEE